MPKSGREKSKPVKNHPRAHAFLIFTALFLIALLTVALLLRFSVVPIPPGLSSEGGFCGTSTESACSSDSGCIIGGCSAQVCGALGDDAVTTCEYRDCYNRVKYNVTCGCLAGKCAWK